MPTYEYACPQGHLTEEFHRMSDEIPRSVACLCGDVATRRYSVPGTIGVAPTTPPPREWTEEEREAREAAPPFQTAAYRCEANHVTVLVHHIPSDGPLPATAPCETCGAQAEHELLVIETDDTNRYPYYDMAMDMVLESPQHRQREIKKRGWLAVDGKADFGRMHNDRQRPMEQAYARYKKNTLDRIANDSTGPYAQYRDEYERKWGRFNA